MDTTEAFIRDAAAKGWSKARTYRALGISNSKFQAILSAIPGLEWKTRDVGAAARAQIRQRRSITWQGRTGTPSEMAQYFPVSERTIRRRLEVGLPLHQVFSPQPQPTGHRA